MTDIKNLPTALKLYRAMSYAVGTMLLVFCAFIILRHGFGLGAKAETVVAQIHGLLYMIYLATVVNVWLKLRPNGGKIVGMICAGFVPFLAFFVERSTMSSLAELSSANNE
jgi:hypothetical protein